MTWPELGRYLIDNGPSIIAILIGAWVKFSQSSGRQRMIEINLNVERVRHDLRNGAGDIIADKAATKTAEHIGPLLEQAGKTITEEVARSNAEVATALAERRGTWDGEERRVGPADRRGQ